MSLREGKVSDSVFASWTASELFQPVLREGRYLVDGVVVNNYMDDYKPKECKYK